MIGPQGMTLLQNCEELRLVAYDDGYGVWTIGWGHTRHVQPGDTCTKEQAERWKQEDLAEAEATVDNLVKVDLTQNQRDALIILAYNIGRTQFAGSEVLYYLNHGRYHTACKAFLGWTKARGKKSRGLLRRRLMEGLLFSKDPWPEEQ